MKLFIVFLFLFVFFLTRLNYYLNILYLNKYILKSVYIILVLSLFYFIYIIYTGDFEYCSNDSFLNSSNNNTSGLQENSTSDIVTSSTADLEQNNTTVNQANNTGNLEENPTTINGQDNLVNGTSNIDATNPDQTRAQEIRNELATLREARLDLIDRHDQIRNAMTSLEESHNTHNNPNYIELYNEDMVNLEQVDAIVEKEDILDLELKAIDPSHETINDQQLGNRHNN